MSDRPSLVVQETEDRREIHLFRFGNVGESAKKKGQRKPVLLHADLSDENLRAFRAATVLPDSPDDEIGCRPSTRRRIVTDVRIELSSHCHIVELLRLAMCVPRNRDRRTAPVLELTHPLYELSQAGPHYRARHILHSECLD
jgi:hypothetical protein